MKHVYEPCRCSLNVKCTVCASISPSVTLRPKRLQYCIWVLWDCIFNNDADKKITIGVGGHGVANGQIDFKNIYIGSEHKQYF